MGWFLDMCRSFISTENAVRSVTPAVNGLAVDGLSFASPDPLWQARLAMSNRDYNQAASLCIQILNSQPRNAVAREMMGELRFRFRKAKRLYRKVQRQIDSVDLSDLKAMTYTAAEIYPGHPLHAQTQSWLDSRIERYTAAFTKGISYMIHDQRDLAIEYMKIAHAINPNNNAAASTIKAIKRNKRKERWRRLIH